MTTAQEIAKNEIELKDFILTVHADKYEIKNKKKGGG